MPKPKRQPIPSFICSTCNLSRPEREFASAGRCIYCDGKPPRSEKPECNHRLHEDEDGYVRCSNCSMELATRYATDAMVGNEEKNTQAALGITVPPQQQHESAIKQIAWSELTALVQRDEERHKRRLRRLERLGTLTEEARGYKAQSARDAFDEIFPPEPVPGSIRKQGLPELLADVQEAHMSTLSADEIQDLISEDVEETPDSYEASTERVQRGMRHARLTKRERDVLTLRSEGKTQDQIAKKLKISQPAVAKTLQQLKKKFEATGLEPPRCQRCGYITYDLTKTVNQFECERCVRVDELPVDDFSDTPDQGESGDRRRNGKSMALRYWSEE